MGRRAVAVIMLLVSALLLHIGVTHHDPLVVAVSAERAAERSEPCGDGAAASDGSHAHLPASHQGGGTDPLGLRSRGQPLAAPVSNDLDMAVVPAGQAARDALAHARTARDRRSPSTGQAPTLVSLQTFRC